MACLQFSKQLLKVLLRKMAYIMAEKKFLLLVIYEHHMTIFKESNIFMVSSQLLVVYKLMLMGPQEYYNTCRALLTHALKKSPQTTSEITNKHVLPSNMANVLHSKSGTATESYDAVSS